MRIVPEALIDEWFPRILISSQVTKRARVAEFIAKAQSGYAAPAIMFTATEAVTIAGRHFAILSRDAGLIPDSVHTLGRHEWHQLFFGITRSSLHPKAGAPPLVVANSGHKSYYHWTLESIGALLMRRLLGQTGPLVMPPLTERWQTDLRELFRIEEPVIEVAPNELAAFDEVALTNLTGRSYSFGPHPALLQEFVRQAPSIGKTDGPKRIYISRFDVPGRRRMENEKSLCDLLRTRGFSIIDTGSLSVIEQAILFRGAEVIVAPHGAGLTNLIYACDGALGPQVIELIHEGYLARGFLKIAQAKALNYMAIVNVDATIGDYHHDGTWRCDLDLVSQTLSELAIH